MIWWLKKVLLPWVSCKAHPIFFIWLLIMPAVGLQAQTEEKIFDPQAKLAYQELFRLKLPHASALIEQNTPINEPVWAYLKHLNLTLNVLITENEELTGLLYDEHKNLLKIVTNLPSDNPWRGFFENEMKIQLAFVKLKRGESFSGGNQLRSAYSGLKKNQASFPQFWPHYKSFGILQILLSTVPDQFHWILKLLGMDASAEEGLRNLKEKAINSELFRDESETMYSLIQIFLLEEYEVGEAALRKKYEQDKESVLLAYLLSTSYLRNNESAKAEKVLNEVKPTFKFTFLEYQRANIQLQKGNYSQAESLFLKFLNEREGDNYLKDSWYKLYLTALLSGNQAKATQYLARAKSEGTVNVEPDKNAERELEDPNINKILMKSRLATDGGFYDIALQTIANSQASDFPSKKDKIEKEYRLARIYDLTGEDEKALSIYKDVISQTNGETWYFAPNSALMAGNILKIKKQFQAAKAMYEKALSYKSHAYKNSIDTKAKAGLASIH